MMLTGWMDEPLWTYEILPSLGMPLSDDGIDDIRALIDQCISDRRFAEGREKARKECWEHMGEGAVRSAGYIDEKYRELFEKDDTI